MSDRAESGSELAPAKINLALHVVGRRADGYHLLDTLVMHGGAADRVSARLADAATGADGAPQISLTVTGPMAAGLDGEGDNLVSRAARLLGTEALRVGKKPVDVALTLEKHLPIASGIGGGSADAAATLRLLDRLWGLDLGRARLAELALTLGADVPMCVDGRPARIGGIGEEISPLDDFPSLSLVLVNPGVGVPTPAVFRALKTRDNPPMPELPPRFRDAAEVAAWLGATRNDLEAAAIEVAPVIADVLRWLRAQPGCLLARMSGSGATCFGLFDAGASTPDRARPGWWVNSLDR